MIGKRWKHTEHKAKERNCEKLKNAVASYNPAL